MSVQAQGRRVTVELLVKATSQQEAARIATDRLNRWFVDEHDLVPLEAGFPVGSLLHFTVTPVTGHRSVAF